MDKGEFLSILREGRLALDELLEAVGAERMQVAGVSGVYSVKDILAHLTAYERGLVKWLQEARAGRAYVDELLDQADLDFRNAVVYQANKYRSPADILNEFHQTYTELEACVGLLTEHELVDAELTAWFVVPRWGNKLPLWECITNDSVEHHQQHIPDIEKWLRQGE